jgi:hypothetical protein
VTSSNLDFPDVLLDEIAERAAALVSQRLEAPPTESEFLTVEEASELLRCNPQRIYDSARMGIRETRKYALVTCGPSAWLKCPSRGPRPSPSQDGRDLGWRSANDVSAGRHARVTDPIPAPPRLAIPVFKPIFAQGGGHSTPFDPLTRPLSLCSSQIRPRGSGMFFWGQE